MTRANPTVIVYGVTPIGGGFAVTANGLPLKTPLGKVLAVPSARLAEEIVKEWRVQTDKIRPNTMPLTQLAATALDLIAADRRAIIKQLLAYVGSELLCHRADEPSTLALRQNQLWQPLLAWCQKRFGADLKIARGIMPIAQTPEAIKAFQKALEAFDDFQLAGLRHTIDTTGSLILGLALAEQHLNAAQLFEAAEIEATFQMERWGEDPATANRQLAMKQELALCEAWFKALKH